MRLCVYPFVSLLFLDSCIAEYRVSVQLENFYLELNSLFTILGVMLQILGGRLNEAFFFWGMRT